ncbi:MAG: phospho-N-acetylmuramoyl-pentapeptide-transferase [Patescibacteria group bacterium]|nr:phospho-N-acetylmuramoyl-pentapeptide-transferase [Patescibacteria group bacterium]
MAILLGLLIFSFLINSFLFVPFINLLYKIRFQRQQQETRDIFGKLTPIFDKLHARKAGIPVGGGLLTLILTPLLFLGAIFMLPYFWVPITSVYPLLAEVRILLLTFLSFGLLGLFDDIKKTFPGASENFFGLRIRHKLILELLLSGIVAFWLYSELQIKIVNITFFGLLTLDWIYIPFAAFVITAFANAFNITDGLDGLASGLLLICLTSFWVISAGILDVPLAIFIALWIGSLIAFLYFNIHPARIFLGDTGALPFGATLAVIGLILGKPIALVIIGGIFVAEVTSSLVQLLSKRFFGKKIFSVAPIHLWFQEKGWEEPTVVMRFWLAGIVLAVFGLFLAAMT